AVSLLGSDRRQLLAYAGVRRTRSGRARAAALAAFELRGLARIRLQRRPVDQQTQKARVKRGQLLARARERWRVRGVIRRDGSRERRPGAPQQRRASLGEAKGRRL